MRKLILLAAGILFLAGTARAQVHSVEASIGYSYFRLGGSGGVNQNGASGSLAVNPNRWLGLVGDFGAYHASPAGVSLNTYSFLFGPRLSLRNPFITPFVQFLVGGAHLTASFAGVTGSSTPFAYSAGGGVDLEIVPHLAFRPQIDYVGLRQSGTTTNCTRVSAGFVIRFGR